MYDCYGEFIPKMPTNLENSTNKTKKYNN